MYSACGEAWDAAAKRRAQLGSVKLDCGSKNVEKKQSQAGFATSGAPVVILTVKRNVSEYSGSTTCGFLSVQAITSRNVRAAGTRMKRSQMLRRIVE